MAISSIAHRAILKCIEAAEIDGRLFAKETASAARTEYEAIQKRIIELEKENLNIWLDRDNRICSCGHKYTDHSRYCDHDECDLCSGNNPCSEFVDASQVPSTEADTDQADQQYCDKDSDHEFDTDEIGNFCIRCGERRNT